ncbi:MAG: hypothetical protein P4L41_01500 [Flavipsychrobacter sp.]|nr:hypothetical protein [Flavipsychrobacter sp.]
MNFVRSVFIILFLFLGVYTHAQEVLYSPYEDFDLKGGDFSVVGYTGGRYYTYRSSGQGYFLDAYNDNMEKEATVLLDFFPSKIYQTKFIAYPDKIIVLYQAVESNKVVQYAALLDATGRLKARPIQLDNVKTGILGPTKTYFSSAISEDKKSIVIFSAKDKGKTFTLDAKFINDSLAILHRTHATYNADNDITHGEPMVGNDGNMYIPVYTDVGGKSYSDQVWLLTLPQSANKFNDHALNLDDIYAGNLYMKVDNANKRVYAGGFYADKKNGSYSGVLYAWYDIGSETFQNKRAIPFDSNMMGSAGHGHRRPFDEYQVKQLIVKNDGGFVLIAESSFITLRSSYAPGFGYYSYYYGPYMNTTVREYHFDDIMALSYDSNGNREWNALVPKEQYSQEDGGLFSSYALLNTGGTLGFLFNDFDSYHSRIQLVTLDAQGKVNTHSFSPEGNDNPDWLPRSGKQVTGRAMMIPCLHKKQICFAKIVF